MNIAYLVYQAERPMSRLERREADARAGQLAAAVTRLGRSLRHAVTGGPTTRWGSEAPAIETITCAVPRSR
jgi:hypothetical protein